MHKLSFLFSLLILQFFSVHAQKISGRIINQKGDPLPYSSILVKGSTRGVTANNLANYEIQLEPGTYTLICQHIGFEASQKEVEVKGNMNLDFILNDQSLMLKEVIISNKGENPAYEIIRQAIKKREFYNNQVNGFDCELYSKDLIKILSIPDKIFGKKIKKEDRKDMMLDSSGKGIVYLSEAISEIYSQKPDKFKMNVKSSRVSGSNSFGFAFPIFINLYTNNVDIFKGGLGGRGFVSPIADGAIHYYKFKMMGTFEENGKTINTIKVTPRRNFEPLFTGVINITDGDWRIHSFELTLTKASQLELIDTLVISQLHVPATDDVWRVKNQLIHFNLTLLKINTEGNFLSVYSDYHINPVFDKKIFDRVVIKYDTSVVKNNRNYWDSIRPVPLAVEEKNDYQKKDSIFDANKLMEEKNRHPDSLRKKQGKLKWHKFITGGVNRVHYGKKYRYRWKVEPLISLSNLSYNTAEGLVLNLDAGYSKYFTKYQSRLTVSPHIRYGTENRHLNPEMTVRWRTRASNEDFELKRSTWEFSGGSRVSQYNKENPIDPLINTFSTLLNGRNYLKTYENTYGSVNYSKTYENGIQFSVNALYEDRKPLENTTNFTFKKNDTINLTPNYPYEIVSTSDIVPHQSMQISFQISIKPGQRYIQFPKSKVPLGSNYPTFNLGYTKGISGVGGSDVDFDKWVVGINDTRTLNLLGSLNYAATAGGFFNRKKVFVQDYKHLQSNNIGATLGSSTRYRLISAYALSNMEPLYSEWHIEHHLKGLLTNKIPVIKKWNWQLVNAAHMFYVNKHTNYSEISVGFENIFKILRIDYVTGFKNGKYNSSGFIIGTGGTLGGGMGRPANEGGSRNSIDISF